MSSTTTKPKAIFFFRDISFSDLKNTNHKDASIYAFTSNKVNSYLLDETLKEKARSYGINTIIHGTNKESKSDYLHTACITIFSMMEYDKTIYTSESIISKSDVTLFLKSLHQKRSRECKFIYIPEAKDDE